MLQPYEEPVATKDDEREELEISGEVPWTWREVLLVSELWVLQYFSCIIQTLTVILPAGCPPYTLLERLWMWILQRNTVPSASSTGRLGTAWFDCGVAITGSKKPAYPSSLSTVRTAFVQRRLYGTPRYQQSGKTTKISTSMRTNL